MYTNTIGCRLCWCRLNDNTNAPHNNDNWLSNANWFLALTTIPNTWQRQYTRSPAYESSYHWVDQRMRSAQHTTRLLDWWCIRLCDVCWSTIHNFCHINQAFEVTSVAAAHMAWSLLLGRVANTVQGLPLSNDWEINNSCAANLNKHIQWLGRWCLLFCMCWWFCYGLEPLIGLCSLSIWAYCDASIIVTLFVWQIKIVINHRTSDLKFGSHLSLITSSETNWWWRSWHRWSKEAGRK